MLKYPSLSREQCEEVLRGLDQGLAVFKPSAKPLSATEIQLKSILSVLRNDVRAHMNSAFGQEPRDWPASG